MAVCEVTQLWVNQSDLSQISPHHFTLDSDTLKDGEALLATDSFGFSANNITYAALGKSMGYWGFFPAPPGFGIVPVWGFATVIATKCEGVEVGEKLFGYLPMASHLVVAPAKITEYGFHDHHANRQSISPVYDNYLRCKADPGYNPSREAWQLNFRPLFMTSFVLDDFVGETITQQNVILSSASSKTAIGTAHLLKQNRAKRKTNYKVIGLTSASNRAFTENSHCYDEVYTYDEIESLQLDTTCWLLDFAANGALMQQLKNLLGVRLETISLIGATDWDAAHKPNKNSLGAEIFFAPAQVKKRTDEWGQQKFLERYAQAWASFAQGIATHMKEESLSGEDSMRQIYLDTLKGEADTQSLNVVTF